MPIPANDLSLRPAKSANLFNWRKAAMLVLVTMLFTTAFSQSKFVKKFRPMVDSLALEFEIPSAVIFGISIIESSSGGSRNCKLLNNYFGIVGKNSLRKTKGIKTRYKQYPNAEASFRDFCRLMTRKKFYKKLKGNMHYKLWIDAISKSNYSEAPITWRQRITTAIRTNKLSTTP